MRSENLTTQEAEILSEFYPEGMINDSWEVGEVLDYMMQQHTQQELKNTNIIRKLKAEIDELKR